MGGDQMTKRLVMLSTPTRTVIDPQFCDHQGAIVTYDDIDGKVLHCDKCGATVDENGQILKEWENDEIPY
jgi:hypothetical protein